VLAVVVGAAATFLALAAPAAASSGNRDAQHRTANPAVNNAGAPKAAPKPQRGSGPAPQLAPWSVSLTANPAKQWPGLPTKITATANQDVGPTTYYIYLYESNPAAGGVRLVKYCGAGTTCAADVTQPANQPSTASLDYHAFIAPWPPSFPPAGTQASAFVTATWKLPDVTLSATANTVGVGEYAELKVNTDVPLVQGRSVTAVYDATTGTRLNWCVIGTRCGAAIPQSEATTHRYVAYVADDTEAFPPTGIQGMSNSTYVTWSGAGFAVSLSAPAQTTNGTVTATATVNRNVGSLWYTQIFNTTTGERSVVCTTTTTCTGTVTLTRGHNDLVAFVAPIDVSPPPTGTVANSNTATTDYTPLH
jgi:hypothetical protein